MTTGIYDDRVLVWFYLGIYLGYSESAIKKFIYVHTTPANQSDWFDDRFTGTGYLSPLEERNEDVHEIVKRINAVRVCPVPFAPLVSQESIKKGLSVHREMTVVEDRVYLLNEQLVERACKLFMSDMKDHPHKKWVKYVRKVANRIEQESFERDSYFHAILSKGESHV